MSETNQDPIKCVECDTYTADPICSEECKEKFLKRMKQQRAEHQRRCDTEFLEWRISSIDITLKCVLGEGSIGYSAFQDIARLARIGLKTEHAIQD